MQLGIETRLAFTQSTRPEFESDDLVLSFLRHHFAKIGKDRRSEVETSVGLELEFPLITGTGNAITANDHLMQYLGQCLGFDETRRSKTDEVIEITSPDRAVRIGYEYTRATLELCLQPMANVTTASQVIAPVLDHISGYLADRDIRLGFTGIHPQAWAKAARPIDVPYYQAMALFMHRSDLAKVNQNFGSFVASSQTHIDADEQNICTLVNMFKLTGFVRALLLANSRVQLPEGDFMLGRDALWEQSAYGGLRQIGQTPVSPTFQHMLQSESENCIFHVKRGDVTWVFDPIPLSDLASRPTVLARSVQGTDVVEAKLLLSPEDVAYFRVIDLVAPSEYGPVEVRGDCQQPRDSIFAPAALSVGLAVKAAQVSAYLSKVIGVMDPHDLRRSAARYGWAMPRNNLALSLSEICTSVLGFAAQGLLERGAGEEEFLRPLFERAEQASNPAA